MNGLGDRIRQRRLEMGLSQRKVSSGVGVTPSFISQLEAGHTRPSLTTLVRLVDLLDLSLDRALRGSETTCEPETGFGPRSAHPRGCPPSGRLIDFGQTGAVCLAIANIPPDSSTQVGAHRGREYGYVAEGTLEMTVGSVTYTLSAGDAITFASNTPHRFRNRTLEPVHAIWFLHPRTEHNLQVH